MAESEQGIEAASLAVAAAALIAVLDEFEALLDAIDRTAPAAYAIHAPPAPGTIGAHLRHCLDHVGALVEAGRSRAGTIRYDPRRRGTSVEFELDAGRRRLQRLRDEVSTLAGVADRPVTVEAACSPDGPVLRTRSSLARETLFAASHMVHHAAVVGALARRQNVTPPAEFGVAASTRAAMRSDG